MTVSDKQIAAYVDDELDEAARGAVTFAALSDPALAERIAAERGLRQRLRAHYAPALEEPVPAEWIAQIRQEAAPASAEVIDLAAARAHNRSLASRPMSRLWLGAALAASLVIGIGIGGAMRNTGPITASGGALLASGDLARALDTQLAADTGPTRMIATFHRQGGALCRVFSGAAASGIACHGGQGWQLLHVMPGAGTSNTAYRQAGSDNPALMAEAQAMAQGDPLDAKAERAARDRGWH